MSNDTKIGYCDNCSYHTRLGLYNSGHPGREGWFCKICARTLLSKATTYPDQVPDTALYKSIGWIANLLLDNITDSPKFPAEEEE